MGKTETPETDQIARVRKHVESKVTDHPVPGVSVALVDGGETVYAAGFGNRDVEASEPATADTLYGVGSATKPVTATAVLQLVADEALSLDDPVSGYLPAFRAAPGEPITIHELLSHTSGLPPDDLATVLLVEGAMEMELPAGPSVDDWSSFSEHVAETVSERQPDSRFRYYNTGYTALSQLVEVVTDESFPTYVRESVFDPLDMDHATFDASVLPRSGDGKPADDAMVPYRQMEDGDLQPTSFPNSPLIDGPGGLLASVRDLGQFLAAFTDDQRLLPADNSRFEYLNRPTRLDS